eukprot:PhF_6_TR19153/c0_g2_i1/m.28168
METNFLRKTISKQLQKSTLKLWVPPILPSHNCFINAKKLTSKQFQKKKRQHSYRHRHKSSHRAFNKLLKKNTHALCALVRSSLKPLCHNILEVLATRKHWQKHDHHQCKHYL